MWIRDVYNAVSLYCSDSRDFCTVPIFFFDKFFLEKCSGSIKKTFHSFLFSERLTQYGFQGIDRLKTIDGKGFH